MGGGIMINCAANDFTVMIADAKPEGLDTAMTRLTAYLDRQVSKGRMAADDATAKRALVTPTTNLGDLADCDLVIEAVFEDLDLKTRIFRELETVVSRDAILATNTSCLRLADIALAVERRDRFCGMHYFSPAEINPIVELISLPQTSQETLNSAADFLLATGKEAITCKDQNGFALNRFFCPYTNEAVRCLDEGLANSAQIDAVARETFGLALGPFAVMNIIGTATNLNAVRNLSDLGLFYAVAPGLEAKGTARINWDIEPEAAPLASEITTQISERLIASVLLPVLEEISEGTATLEAIDKGAKLAFRFEKTPGKLLANLGAQDLKRMLSNLVSSTGHPLPDLSHLERQS